MSTSEEPIPESTNKNLTGAASEGAAIVGVAMNAPSKEIVAAINKYLEPPNTHEAGIDNWTDRALPIGCLWAHAIIERCGWTWASLIQHDHDDYKVIAIVSPDRSFAIFPFHYCFGCLENDVYPTILLAYNMLEAGTIPTQEANGYINLMDGVHHIIPPN